MSFSKSISDQFWRSYCKKSIFVIFHFLKFLPIYVGHNAPPNPVPCYNWYRPKMYICFIHYQLYNICNILLKHIIVSQRTVSVHYILPNLWQKPAVEFPKKIIHLKVWSTIHVLSFNPKFDLNPRLTHIPKQGIVGWELSFRKKKNLQIFVVKQGYTWFMLYLTDLLTPKVLR